MINLLRESHGNIKKSLKIPSWVIRSRNQRRIISSRENMKQRPQEGIQCQSFDAMGYERDIYKKNIIFRNIGSCDTEYSLSMFNTRFRIIQGSPWQRFYCYTVRVTSTYVNSAYYTLNLSIRYLPIAGCTFTKGQWVFFAFFPISFSHKIAAVILKII